MAQSSGGFVGRAPPTTTLEQVDPAVRRFESDRCVQQRARGWGRTGDCDHPAYGGSGAPVIIVTPPARFGDSAPSRPNGSSPPRQRPDWAW